MRLFTLKLALSNARNVYLWIAIFFIIFVAWYHFPDIKSLVKHLKSIPNSTVFIALLLAFASYYCRALRWLVYMRLKELKAGVFQHILIYISGFSFTVSPGKAGEMIRSSHLSPLGVPFSYTFSAFITERFLDVLTVLFLGVYFLVEVFDILFIMIAFVAVLTLLFIPLILKLLTNIVKSESINVCLLYLQSLWQQKVLKINLLYSLLAWSFQGGILYLILSGFGVNIGLFMAISIYGLSLLIGAASLIPSGIGATELGMTWLLIQVGLESEIAIISSLFTRMLTLWPAMLLGLVSAFVLKIRDGRKV